MLRFNSKSGSDGKATVEIGGSSLDVAMEALGLMAAVKRALKDRGGELDALVFEAVFLASVIDVLKASDELPLEKSTPSNKDIRSADFDTDDEFLRFLRGLDRGDKE